MYSFILDFQDLRLFHTQIWLFYSHSLKILGNYIFTVLQNRSKWHFRKTSQFAENISSRMIRAKNMISKKFLKLVIKLSVYELNPTSSRVWDPQQPTIFCFSVLRTFNGGYTRSMFSFNFQNISPSAYHLASLSSNQGSQLRINICRGFRVEVQSSDGQDGIRRGSSNS